MGNLLRSEWFKLWKDRVFWTLLLALAVSAVFYTVLVFFDQDGSFNAVSVSLLYADALSGNGYIIRLIPGILAGFFISNEYATGTMKSMVASGNSRIRIYSAKLIMFMLGTSLLAMMFPLFLTGTAAIGSGFYDMPEWDFWLRTLGLHMLYAAGFASIMGVLAFLFTDSGKTIGFLLLFFLLVDSILFMVSQKVAWFKPVFEYSIFKLFHDIGQESLAPSGWFALLAVPIVTSAAFWVLGNYMFYRKEIK